MDWSAIIYAAIGGGGGSLLGTALGLGIQKMMGKSAKSETDGKSRSGVVAGLGGGLAVVGMMTVPALYKNMTFPRLVPIDQNEIFEGAPIYEVIKEQSPEDFERLLLPIDRAARNGEITQGVLDEMRVVLFRLIAEKRAKASAKTLRALEEVTQSQALVLKAKKPSICTLMINGESYPAVADYFDEAEVQLEQDVMEQLFTNPPRDVDFVADIKRGESLMSSIASATVKETGVDNLRPGITKTGENEDAHRKICDFLILYSSKKTELNDEELLDAIAYEGSL